MSREVTINRLTLAGFESRAEMLEAIIASLQDSMFFAMKHGDKKQVTEIRGRLSEAKRRYAECRSY